MNNLKTSDARKTKGSSLVKAGNQVMQNTPNKVMVHSNMKPERYPTDTEIEAF